ncbi:MAG: hypothetical protein QOI12_4604 [Alphaproteobacteria bacterium]|nr:hypothetical protein [Alphaproteobacteria bacterium]
MPAHRARPRGGARLTIARRLGEGNAGRGLAAIRIEAGFGRVNAACCLMPKCHYESFSHPKGVIALAYAVWNYSKSKLRNAQIQAPAGLAWAGLRETLVVRPGGPDMDEIAMLGGIQNE